jgi:hypothetical protein
MRGKGPCGRPGEECGHSPGQHQMCREERDDHGGKDADVHHGLNSFPYIFFRGSIKSETSA